MNLDEMAERSGEWLKGEGPESDIVVSSRIRLARNLTDYPFISKATDLDRAEIEKTLRKSVVDVSKMPPSPIWMLMNSTASIGSSWSSDS